MRRFRYFAMTALAGITLLPGCSDSDPTSSGSNTLDRLQILTGDAAVAMSGSEIATPPRVIARDGRDRPLPGVMVTFSVTGGGGSIHPETPVETDEFGVAALTAWTLGTEPGTNTLVAEAEGVGTTISATFTGTAVPALASAGTSTLLMRGDASPVADGAAGGVAEVLARDEFGNPVSGALIHFSIEDGAPGRVTPVPLPTDDSGLASTTVTSLTAGPVTVIARVGSAEGPVIGEGTMVFIPGTTHAGTSSITVDGSRDARADGQDSVTVRVTVRDGEGNVRTSGGDEVRLSASVGTIGEVRDMEDGTYVASVHSTRSGRVRVTAYLGSDAGGSEIGSTRMDFRAGPADASRSTISADPDTAVQGNGLSHFTVQVTVRDAHGNLRDGFGDHVVLTSDGGAIGAITDHGDGRHTASVTADQGGSVTVRAFLNGQSEEFGQVELEFTPPPLLAEADDWSRSGAGATVEQLAQQSIRLRWDSGQFSASWQYAFTADASGTLNLDWALSACHSWFHSTGLWRVQVDGPDGAEIITLDNGGGCPRNRSGSVLLDVHEGYEVRVLINGSHADGSMILRGHLDFTRK